MNQLFNTNGTLNLFLTFLLIGCFSGVVYGQGEHELRRENQQLITRIQDMEQELAAAVDRIADLEDRIDQLEALLAEGLGDHSDSYSDADESPLPDEEISIDESNPSASPRALLAALIKNHQESMGELELGERGDTTRRVYLRKLNSWVESIEREFRSPITWHVKIVEQELETKIQLQRNRTVTLIAVDPQTDVVLGNQFTVQLPRHIADRLATNPAIESDAKLVLNGVITPQAKVNEERLSRGSFDNPPFIGPLTEFGFSIDVRSLKSAMNDEK